MKHPLTNLVSGKKEKVALDLVTNECSLIPDIVAIPKLLENNAIGKWKT